MHQGCTFVILIWASMYPLWPTLSPHSANPLVHAVCPSSCPSRCPSMCPSMCPSAHVLLSGSTLAAPFPMLIMPQYGFVPHSPPHIPHTCHFCYAGRILEYQKVKSTIYVVFGVESGKFYTLWNKMQRHRPAGVAPATNIRCGPPGRWKHLCNAIREVLPRRMLLPGTCWLPSQPAGHKAEMS